MKNYKFLSLFLILSLLASLLCLPCAAVEPGPSVAASSAVVLDRRSGSVIYSKNADARVYPASITKIMTTLLAIEAVERGDAALSDQVTATRSAMEGLSALGSTSGITAGETLTLEQLLYCTLLSSANEACNIIAEHIAGDRQSFIDRMNERAAALGCSSNTHFANAHGLPNLEHYTTAADFALIALEATRHPLFMEICGTAETQIPATNKAPARSLHNSNALLCSDSVYGSKYVYPGTEGIKTGHTTAAGYCLASAATRNGVALLTLVFGDNSSDACFRDTIALYDWAFSNYSYQEILHADDCVGTVPVLTNGALDYVELYPADDFIILLPNDCDLSEFSQEITVFGTEGGKTLTGPLAPGTVLGRVQLLKNGEDYGSMDLVPMSASALVMDQKSGEILFSKGADNRVYPAELTAVMTALLAVEAVEQGKVSMNASITATEAMNIDLGPESHTVGLAAGETVSLEYLLSCAILGGGDDACNVIAEYVAGSVPTFVAQMNLRATELGCTGTNFTNTHGAFNSEHYTTARDFSLIALAASRHEQLAQFFAAPVLELAETDISPARTLRNSNALLCDESAYGAGYLYEGATGMKAGYNGEAGYTLAATATRGDISLLCLVFDGEKTGSGYSHFADAASVFDQVFDNYSYQEIIKSTENIASVDIMLGQDSDYVNLRPSKSISVLLPKDYDASQFETQIRVYALENGEPVSAPISAGQVLGEVTLYRNGHSYGTVKLEASSSVELSRMQYIRSQLRETTRQTGFRVALAVLVLLFLLYLAWVITYRVKRLRHVQALRAAEKARKARLAAVASEAEAAPDISFFRKDSPAAPHAPAAEAEADDGDSKPASNIITLHRPAPEPAPEPTPESTPEPKPAPKPTPTPAAPDSNDLLREAVCVATLEPQREETAQEKAERDYFEEFFRKK